MRLARDIAWKAPPGREQNRPSLTGPASRIPDVRGDRKIASSQTRWHPAALAGPCTQEITGMPQVHDRRIGCRRASISILKYAARRDRIAPPCRIPSCRGRQSRQGRWPASTDHRRHWASWRAATHRSAPQINDSDRLLSCADDERKIASGVDVIAQQKLATKPVRDRGSWRKFDPLAYRSKARTARSDACAVPAYREVNGGGGMMCEDGSKCTC